MNYLKKWTHATDRHIRTINNVNDRIGRESANFLRIRLDKRSYGYNTRSL
jgi:hypothetical protein